MKNCFARYARGLLIVFFFNHAGVSTVGGEVIAWAPCMLVCYPGAQERLIESMAIGNLSYTDEQKVRALLIEMEIPQAKRIRIKKLDEEAVPLLGAPVCFGERIILISRRFLTVASDLDLRIELARAQIVNSAVVKQAIRRDTFLATGLLCAATYAWRARYGALLQKMAGMQGMQYAGIKLFEQVGSWGSWAPTRAGIAFWALCVSEDYHIECAQRQAQKQMQALIDAHQPECVAEQDSDDTASDSSQNDTVVELLSARDE